MNILAVCALLMTAASPVPAVQPVSIGPAVAPAVIVKIGSASLEEYRHGDPANRVQQLSESHSETKL